MATPGWLKPWMVALVLALAGGGGAVAIERAGHSQHVRDTADLDRWSANVQPIVVRARAGIDALSGAGAQQRASLRAGLTAARDALAGTTAPQVVGTVAQDYLGALETALAAVDALARGGTQAAYARAIAQARAEFASGDALLSQINCRVAGRCAKT